MRRLFLATVLAVLLAPTVTPAAGADPPATTTTTATSTTTGLTTVTTTATTVTSSATTSSATTTAVLLHPGPGLYRNPFADPRWIAGRLDMGMDWAPLRRLPVLAVGDGVVLGADSHSGWPGHHLIWYELTDGPLAGTVIYVAEHLTKLARAGATVTAGQRIAIAIPGYPYIETGWADAYGSPRAYPCYKEGVPTNSGREMARFLAGLGAYVGLALHSGASRPAGRLC